MNCTYKIEWTEKQFYLSELETLQREMLNFVYFAHRALQKLDCHFFKPCKKKPAPPSTFTIVSVEVKKFYKVAFQFLFHEEMKHSFS